MMLSAALAVALAAGPAAARLVKPLCDGTAKYKIMVDMTWSAENHPTEFPEGGAFFTPFFGMSHNLRASLWTRGGHASPAIEALAETGDSSGIVTDVEECGDACSELYTIPCGPEMTSVCSGSMMVEIDPSRPYVSLASMLVPSPDWFSGIDSWNLCVDGEWVDEVSRPVQAYDAGTDSGLGFGTVENFVELDIDTDPAGPIVSFGQIRPKEMSTFYNPSKGMIVPVGSVTITKMMME